MVLYAMEDQIYRCCIRHDDHPERLDEARALIEQHGIDINADWFGEGTPDLLEPLLHAVARRARYKAYLMLRTIGADPNRLNSRGKTALYVALDNKAPYLSAVTSKQISVLLNEDRMLGLATSEALIQDYMMQRRAHEVQYMIDNGVPLANNKGVKLTHVAVKSNDPEAVLLVADSFHLDFKERDADGKTALECARTPEMREILLDAGADTRTRDLAVMMAFHPRLGADSPIRSLEAGVVLAMVLPYTSRVEDIRVVRERRLKALIDAEGIVVSRRLRTGYVKEGAMFAPACFRLEHFLCTSGRSALTRLESSFYKKEEALTVFKRRLEWRGLFFTEPFTPDYEERAKEAIEHPLLDEDAE